MAEIVVRFDQEQQEWSAWEARARAKFGEEVTKSKPFLKDRLAHLEGIEINYRAGANAAEKRELRILKGQRREIEKKLYPGILQRLSYRIVQLVIISKMQNKQKAVTEINQDRLLVSLSQKGFGNVEDQLRQQLKTGLPEFKIAVSYQVNENSKMSYNLQFQRNQDGTYQIKEIKATIRNHNDGKSSSMLFSSIPGETLTARQAYNLLAGRAVERQGDWHMLDHNDKDSLGNLKTKVFVSDYGFSVEKLLDQTGIKEIKDLSVKASILRELRNGEVLSVGTGRKSIKIEANPQHLSLENPFEVQRRRELKKQSPKTVKLEKKEVNKVSKVKMGSG